MRHVNWAAWPSDRGTERKSQQPAWPAYRVDRERIAGGNGRGAHRARERGRERRRDRNSPLLHELQQLNLSMINRCRRLALHRLGIRREDRIRRGSVRRASRVAWLIAVYAGRGLNVAFFGRDALPRSPLLLPRNSVHRDHARAHAIEARRNRLFGRMARAWLIAAAGSDSD